MNRPNIYVIQNQHRWDEEKAEYVPRFDLAPARIYGNLKSLLTPTAAPFMSKGVIKELHEKLEHFTDDDYLLLIGNPALIGFAVAIAAFYNEGRVALLQWSGKDQNYIPIRAEHLND